VVFDKLIHQRVAAAIAADPAAVAVTAGDTVLSYGDLDARAAALAGRLRERGVEVGSRVAIAVPRSIDFVVAALAVLRAGGAYVPIDPDYPASRREFILDDSGATLVVTAGTAVPGPVPAIDLHAGAAVGRSIPDSAPPPAVQADDLAYIIYTSGSTGVPKGACITHAAVVELTEADPRLAVRRGDVVAHLAPTAFDAATFEIWSALTRGGTVAALGKHEISVAELGRTLRRVRPDWLFLTTGLFHLLVDHDVAMFGAVGTVITGGDVLSPQHVRAAARVVRRDLYAAYGPTETTVFASLHKVDPERAYQRVPLGRALRGKVLHVLDDDLRQLPPGTVGEIYLGGGGLARCYHRRGALTAARFLPDPYSAVPGARLYRSGDLGVRLPDGEVEFAGRTDRQVKVRGFRVEPGEIEAVLSAHESVGAAAVLAIGDNENDKRLVAYVAPAGRARLDTARLRSWVGDALPAHLAPAQYVLLEALALDPNGKVDRAALPRPWTARADFGLPAMVAPSSDAERMIADVMAEVLALDEVGVDDDFYALGGDSLRSMRLLEQLRTLGVQVSAREFLSRPTVGALTELAGVRQPVGGGQ
jgi:amino acid adenylation domain-containing protein